MMPPEVESPADVALIGCGRITETGHLPVYLSDPQLRVVAVCDPAKERRDTVGDPLGVPNTSRFATLAELADSATTATVAVVASPTATHQAAITSALDARLHVVSEKPATPGLAAAHELLRYAERRDRRIAVLHNYLTAEPWRYLIGQVAAGSIGTPRGLEVRLADPGPLPGFHPTHQNWRTDRALAGGGCLLDQGYHYVYLAEVLFGPISRIERVILSNTSGWNVEDRAEVEWRHADGGRTTLTLDWSVAQRKPPYHRVTGDEGELDLDEDNATVTARSGALIDPLVDASNDPAGYHLALPAAIRAVHRDSQDTMEPGLRVLRILDACYEAARTGGFVAVAAS